jgi:hypothetical protein
MSGNSRKQAAKRRWTVGSFARSDSTYPRSKEYRSTIRSISSEPPEHGPQIRRVWRVGESRAANRFAREPRMAGVAAKIVLDMPTIVLYTIHSNAR